MADELAAIDAAIEAQRAGVNYVIHKPKAERDNSVVTNYPKAIVQLLDRLSTAMDLIERHVRDNSPEVAGMVSVARLGMDLRTVAGNKGVVFTGIVAANTLPLRRPSPAWRSTPGV